MASRTLRALAIAHKGGGVSVHPTEQQLPAIVVPSECSSSPTTPVGSSSPSSSSSSYVAISLPKRSVNMHAVAEAKQRVDMLRAVGHRAGQGPPVPAEDWPFPKYESVVVTPMAVKIVLRSEEWDRVRHWTPVHSRSIMRTPGAVVHVLRGVVQSLRLLHAVPMAHTALSSTSTIMLDRMGKVRISGAFVTPSLFAKGSGADTQYYRLAAPEIQRRDVYGCAADVWSLGVLVLEMLLPSFVISTLSTDDIVDANILAPTLGNLHPALISLCVACLKNEPGDRLALHEVIDHPALQHAILQRHMLSERSGQAAPLDVLVGDGSSRRACDEAAASSCESTSSEEAADEDEDDENEDDEEDDEEG